MDRDRRGFLKSAALAAMSPSILLGKRSSLEARTPIKAEFAKNNRADLVFSPECNEPFYVFNADQLVYSASVTKEASLDVVFTQISAGKISLQDKFPVTREIARATAAGRWNSGLVGSSITVEEGIVLAGTRSHNDVMRSLAQWVSAHPANRDIMRKAGLVPGTEQAFCEGLMKPLLDRLEMASTSYPNSTGLPPYNNGGQKSPYYNVTTLNDLKKLCTHLITEHHELVRLLARPSVEIPGRLPLQYNTNPLLENSLSKHARPCPGVWGLKTGTSIASRLNAVVAAERFDPFDKHPTERGQVIVISTGHPDRTARINHITALVEKGFRDLWAVRALRRIFNTPSFISDYHPPTPYFEPPLQP